MQLPDDLQPSHGKPAKHRLVASSYPWSIEIQTRFGDLDTLGHLNNVSITRLYEEARARFGVEQTHGPDFQRGEWQALVANLNIQYLAEAHYPVRTVVALGISHIGRTSHVVSNALFQHDRCVGLCDCTIVVVSRDTHRPIPIPERLRHKLDQFRIRSHRADVTSRVQIQNMTVGDT